MREVITKNKSIDIIKGWGILFVIIGHILLCSTDENILHYIIYSFHMPLFFFISGYLLNVEKLGMLTLSQFLGKYMKRMLGWWFLAWMLYTVLVMIANQDFSMRMLWRNIQYPYCHLWFVPGLFIPIALSFFIKRYMQLDKDKLAVVLILIGVFQMMVSKAGYIAESYIRHYNILFFALGATVKQVKIKKCINMNTLCIIYAVIILFTKYYVPETFQSMCRFSALQCLFVLGLSPIIQEDGLKGSPVMEWIGRNSLHIYLWHMIPIAFFKQFMSSRVIVYYLVSFGFFALFLLAEYLRSKMAYVKNN